MPGQVKGEVLFDTGNFGNKFQLPVNFLVGRIWEHLFPQVGGRVILVFFQNSYCR
jgi:hypothetical protein